MLVLLYGPDLILKKEYIKIYDFQLKKTVKKVGLFLDNQGVTHRENILWPKTFIIFEIVLKTNGF